MRYVSIASPASSGLKLISPRPHGMLVNAHHSAEINGEWYRYLRGPTMRGCSFSANAVSVLKVRRVPSRMIFGTSFIIAKIGLGLENTTSGVQQKRAIPTGTALRQILTRPRLGHDMVTMRKRSYEIGRWRGRWLVLPVRFFRYGQSVPENRTTTCFESDSTRSERAGGRWCPCYCGILPQS